MVNSPIIEMTDDWKKKEELEAHNYLEQLGKPDELNDLIMTKVNLILEKLPRQCDATEVRGDIATLSELLQIREFKNELKRKRVERSM